MYLQQLGVREALHTGGTFAQNIRDRLFTLRFVQFLDGPLVEQEDRDLL